MEAVTIRPAVPEDAPALLAIYAPYVRETAVTFEYEVPTPEEFAGRIRRTLERYPYLAAQSGGEVLGYACAGAFKERAAYDWSVETTIYLHPDHTRHGYGRALMERLIGACRERGYHVLVACITVSRSLSSRGSTTWVSGSPKRQLYSITFGPLGVSINPK